MDAEAPPSLVGEGGALGEAAVEIRRCDGGKSFIDVDVDVDFGIELASLPPAAKLPLGLLRRIATAVTRELMKPGRMRWRKKERARDDSAREKSAPPTPTSVFWKRRGKSGRNLESFFSVF